MSKVYDDCGKKLELGCIDIIQAVILAYLVASGIWFNVKLIGALI